MSNKDKVGAVLVVGGGIGGTQASLDLAEAGFKVYLVEKESAIGGVMAQLDKTFPTNDCAMCTLAPRLVDAARHLNIDKITNAEVVQVNGSAGNFTILVKQKTRYIDPSKCTGCGACVEKCPVRVDSEFDVELIKRTAIYRRYPQAVPGTFTIDKQGVSPCRFACPANVNAHAYVTLIAQGRFAEALEVERRQNPFPAICGRVCPHPCEMECSRGALDAPLAIAPLKRFLADWELAHPDQKAPLPKIAEPKHKKVAIIGSGPTGLSAARDLAIMGYQVTIFESLSVAGGMLRWGIPAYRLPKDLLQKEIETVVLDLGVELKLNTPVGTNLTLDNLKSQGYEAFFLATGTPKCLTLDIPGSDFEGVLDAVNLLREVNLGKGIKLNGKVAVIGGGNVAVDAARTAWRLGAEEVTIVYRRSRNEMPADPTEIEEAEEEGIKILFLAAPREIIGQNGKVTGLKCVKMALGEPDASGRRRPVPVEDSDFTQEVNYVIAAISQTTDLEYLGTKGKEIRTTKLGTIMVDPATLSTDVPGIFAGGDVVSGPATVIEAIAAGKEAAISIDRYLSGQDMTTGREIPEKVKVTKEIEGLKKKPRLKMATLPVSERKGNFKEVVLGYTETRAQEEAARCLNCAVCCECLKCVETCEAKAINHEMERETILTLNSGAIILAPGYELFDPDLKQEFGYGRYPNVISSLQFERILSASGPFMGKVLRPSDQKPPKKIAFIQCVGSREVDRNYCSSVCCMYATKEAIIAKEHEPELDCHIFFIDLRAFSKGFDQYYERAKELGVKYTRCRPSAVKEVPATKNLLVQYQTEDGALKTDEFDIVVLSSGLCPPPEVEKLSKTFGIDLNAHHFCKTTKFAPVETNKSGIYTCGPFTEPKDIPETVMQSCGAAAKAMALLTEVRGTMVVHREYPPEIDVTGQEPRIGVFVCHCGKNIGGVANVPSIVEYAKTLPNVVYAEDNLYTCSADTQVRIKEKIKEHNLNRVVVASCTPRTHEPLFRDTIREAGLNPYLFEMANIRDQNTWVHMHEPREATRKAKDLVRIALAKSRLLEPLQKRSLAISHDALVIGGGLSGMTASLELTQQGFTVYLVEKGKELGGNLKKLHYLLEDNYKPQEELKALIEKVKTTKKIQVYLEAEIKEVAGSMGNFKTTLTGFNGNPPQEIKHGIIIVATGAQEYKPKEYLYGEDPRVLTQLELEDKIAHNELLRTPNLPSRQAGSQLQTVVMIQCVGSRNKERPYCSRLCCADAIKNALKIKQLKPDTSIYVLYRDIRAYGFREEYYRKAREAGVIFIKYNDNDNPVVSKGNDHLSVLVNDPILNRSVMLNADILVLSAAIIPPPDNEDLSKKLKVPLNQDKFFLEAHMKLRPVDFATDGIFLCGLTHYPKEVDESIAQACAAVSRATTILAQEQVELDAIVSQVIDENCDGCAYCIDPCPYHALTLIEYARDGSIKKTVDRDLALCKGCGVCQATCPKGGIVVNNFKLPQLLAMVGAALEPPTE